MARPKIDPGVRAYIEEELRSYRGLKAKVKQLQREKSDIYNRSRQLGDNQPRGSGPSDPTFKAAIRLEKLNRQIETIEKRIATTEAGLAVCTRDERKLLEARYMQDWEPTDRQVMAKLYYGSAKTYYDLKFRGLWRLAWHRGMAERE